MANLCGANEAIDNALSKAADLKNDILGKLELPASDIAASLNNKLTELKSALDGLAIDLPSLPDVNLQAEITGAISDIDQTTIQGKIAFASKLAKLKLDFGDTVTELGLDLDKLIVSGTSLISGGGDICALIPNLDISAANSGTGVTTEEIVERSSTANLTLTQTPKEILSVQGKKTGQSFFTNINHKQNGLVIVPSAEGTYSEIKVTYIVSLIKEKPINSKQADKKEEQETAPIIVTNSNAVDTKTFSSFISDLAKYKTKSILGLATDKELAGIQSGISLIGSPELKKRMNADVQKANNFDIKGEFKKAFTKKTISGPRGKTNTINVTSVKDQNITTTETVKSSNGVDVQVKKTEKSTVSEKGYTHRQIRHKESFRRTGFIANDTMIANDKKGTKFSAKQITKINDYKELDDLTNIVLRAKAHNVKAVRAYSYKPDGTRFSYKWGVLLDGKVYYMIEGNNLYPDNIQPGKGNLVLMEYVPITGAAPFPLPIDYITITYLSIEKIEPSFS